jgi:hypothetical protein
MKHSIQSMPLVITVIALLLLVAGCGMTVQQRMAVGQFGSATTEFASLTRSEFIQSRQDVIEMNRYRILLGDDSVKSLDEHFTPERLQPRFQALDALSRYGDLLQSLLTTSSSADLRSSADGFVSSLNEIQGVNISEADGEMLGKVVSFGGSFFVEYKRAQAMKKTVEFAHRYVMKTIALVENDFDPNNDLWNAGYRHTRIELEGAIADVPPLATNDLAGEQVLRAAKLAAGEGQGRFDEVSKRILEVAKKLSQAENELRLAMLNGSISIADIQEYRTEVGELKTLFELLQPQKANN